jgi:hypothetical protein
MISVDLRSGVDDESVSSYIAHIDGAAAYECSRAVAHSFEYDYYMTAAKSS